MHKKLVFILISLFISGILDNAYGKTDTQKDIQKQNIEKMIDTANMANTDAENRQERDSHYARIVRAHADYEKIVYNPNFPMYISSLPSTICNRAKDIIANGTSSEIIKLLYGYKDYDIPGILKNAGDTKASQTPVKFLRGMINKNEIITIVNESEKLHEETERHKELHFRKIARAHPNYERITFSTDFINYIRSLPAKQMEKSEVIFESGSAEEIIALLSAYKKRPQK